MFQMDDLSKNQIFAVHGIAVAGSVALATGFTYPLDTIKVLNQVGSSGGKELGAAQLVLRVLPLSANSAMERRFLKWKQPGNRFERYTGIHPSDRNLLIRGIGLQMAASVFASFKIVGSYFFVVDHLASSLT